MFYGRPIGKKRSEIVFKTRMITASTTAILETITRRNPYLKQRKENDDYVDINTTIARKSFTTNTDDKVGDHYHLHKLNNFYNKVDEESNKIVEKATKLGHLNCKVGCNSCCVGGISVSQVEAEYILSNVTIESLQGKLNDVHTNSSKNSPMLPPVLVDPSLEALVRGDDTSRCSFLSKRDGSCSIYNHRPFVCRFMGLPLRWLEEHPTHSNTIGEARDVCPINDECLNKPIEELSSDQCYPVDDIWETELDTINKDYVASRGRNVVSKDLESGKNDTLSGETDRSMEEIALKDIFEKIVKQI